LQVKPKLWFLMAVCVSLVACGGAKTSELLSAEPVRNQPAAAPAAAPIPVSTEAGDRFKAIQHFFFAYRDSPVETQINVFRSNLAAFAPAVEIEEEVESVENAPVTPLQVYDVDSYKLVLIMSGTAEPKALVYDPQDKGYIITVGDMIGNRGGRVVSITGSEVRIEEPGFAPNVKSLMSSDEDMLRELMAVQEY